jgi:hypothetical protein
LRLLNRGAARTSPQPISFKESPLQLGQGGVGLEFIEEVRIRTGCYMLAQVFL